MRVSSGSVDPTECVCAAVAPMPPPPPPPPINVGGTRRKRHLVDTCGKSTQDERAHVVHIIR